MTGFYDPHLVTLSLIVAIMASYTALELAGHVSRKQGKSSWMWLIGGAVSMGAGIWSMHFIGMLAFHLPVAMAYDAAITALSMAIAVVVSGLALFVVSRKTLTGRNLTGAATLMGLGISAMHYTGMHAMRMSPPIEYDPPMFIASVIIALVASFVALWIAFRLRQKGFGVAVLAKAGSATVMGLAIAGMHYTGMAAARFPSGSICLAHDATGGMESATLAHFISIVTIGILALTLGASAIEARFTTARKRGEEELLRFGAAMNATADAIYLIDRSSMRFVHLNDAACRMLDRTREELLALSPMDVLSTSRAELERTYDTLIAEGDLKPVEMLLPRPNGSPIWVEVRRHAQRSEESWTIVTLVRDVTERKEAANRIVHLNRVYAMVSGINTLIVRVRDRDELFEEACRVAVEAGGFRMSLIATVDRSVMKIVPVASAGKDEGLLSAVKDLLSATGVAHITLVARAIRERKAIVSNDSQNDPGVLLGKRYAESGVRSIAILPLIVSEEAIGVLALYAGEVEFFQENEMDLLTELTDAIAFCITAIRARVARETADEALRSSLKENKVLLKEVHHRVKNNMQVITSLLRLESNRIDHPSTNSVLKDMQNRIQAMAALHEAVYRSNNFSQVDLAVYLKQITTQLGRSLVATPGQVSFHIDLLSVGLALDQAIPCGLMVNELVSNALKHGFPAGRSGEVRVELRHTGDGDLRLCVTDNGVGLPPDFEARRGKSLGLQLISDLAKQLHGRLEVGPGPSFKVTFKPEHGEKPGRPAAGS